MTASLDLWMWPSDGQDSEGHPDGGHGPNETMFDRVARGGVQATGSAGGDDNTEIDTLGASTARSERPYDEAVRPLQGPDVPSLHHVRGEPAVGGGVAVGAWAPHDGGHSLAVDSVPDMAGAVHCTCTDLGGSGGSGDGTAGGDAVGVRVAVAGGGDGGASRAPDEGVHRVVPGQPEAETVAGGSCGGAVPGGADGAASPPVGGGGPALSAAPVRDDAASRETMACDVSGGDLRQPGFQSWKARKTALKNQKRALARPPQHP